MMKRLDNLSLRGKFMLAPVIGILMMAVLAVVLLVLIQRHDRFLIQLQNEEFLRAQTLAQLSNRIAHNHTQIFELLRAAETETDEGALYDSGKPSLLEIHRIEARLKEEQSSAGLSEAEIRSFDQLLENLVAYRINTTNAMLTATVDLGLANDVMSNSTKQFNQLNTGFLMVIESIQSRLKQGMALHSESVTRHSRLFAALSMVAIVMMLAISLVLARFMSRDLRLLIARLDALLSRQRSSDNPDTAPGNEVAILAAAVDSVRESHNHLEQTRDELSEANQRLEKSNATIQEREAALSAANQALEKKIAEQQETIIERDRAEEGLRRAQRLEAVGQLTGGVAHDFNNLLSVMAGHTDMVRDAIEADPEALKSLDAISSAIDDSASLTARLLSYSRQQTLAPVPANVAGLFDGLTDMLRRALGETIAVKVDTAREIWPALIDPHQFENALLNLAINARDAMPNGGTLVIETANVTLDEDYANREAEVTPGDYVMIAVSDTGTGMPPEICAKAFEPFFTTKDVGLGSGLGLSMVYGFAKQSEGHLTIYSEVGQGTTVKLYLPRSEAGQPVHPCNAAPRFNGPTDGSERILILEDNEEVRAIAITVLRGQGYEVVEAVDGADALRQLEHGGRFALLFTDVVLPGGKNGVQVAAEARQLQPEDENIDTDTVQGKR